MVANAGIASRVATFRAMPSETFERVSTSTCSGVCRTVDAALPQMIERRGHVVVISSIYAFMNGIGAIPYAMSKAAVEQFGRALRVELHQHGASASVAYFGFIDTEMVHRRSTRTSSRRRCCGRCRRRCASALPASVAGEAIVTGNRTAHAAHHQAAALDAPVRAARHPGPARRRPFAQRREPSALARAIDARGGEDQPTTA